MAKAMKLEALEATLVGATLFMSDEQKLQLAQWLRVQADRIEERVHGFEPPTPRESDGDSIDTEGTA